MTVCMTKHLLPLGADVRVDDLITFAPGNKPIRVVRFDDKAWHHPALNMSYRVFYDPQDIGYVLFDEASVWPVKS